MRHSYGDASMTKNKTTGWSDHDMEVLRAYYPSEGYIGVQKRLSKQREKQAIVSMAYRIGLKSSAPRPGHRMVGTRTYRAWYSAKNRATNKNCDYHYLYEDGGMCERWMLSFEAFLDDMGDAPSDKHQIDRIDPMLGYRPGNCRWVTARQNTQNIRKKSNSAWRFKGIAKLPSGRWRAQLTLSTGRKHIGVFDTDIEAARAYDRAAEQAHGEYAMTNAKMGLLVE